MKFNIKAITYFITAIVLLASCSEDSIVEDNVQGLTELVICASPSTTRTSLGNDGTTVVWEESDEIAVYDYNTSKHRFAAHSVDNNQARFIGKITRQTDYFLALYPYALGKDNLSENQEIVATLPSIQNAALNTFGSNLNISVAKGARNVDGSPSNVKFYNVCQLLKFNIPDYAAGKIKEIAFNANTSVAGTLNVNCSANRPVAQIGSDGNKSITILPPADMNTFDSGTYYIVSAPVILDGFSMSFTCDGKSYTLNSNTTFGGTAGKIYSLGNIDLVNTPNISAQHVYSNGILQGTSVTISNAPIEGREWNAVVKNSGNNTVRNISGTGTLISSEQDQNWPYLPKGNYTVEYKYTTSNGKVITKSQSFSITEDPQFSVTTTAYTSFSYYKGDGVSRNITTANSLDNMTIYEPKITINNVAPKLFENPNYSFKVSNSFNGIQTSYNSGVYSYSNYTVGSYAAYTLIGTVEFDGVTRTSNKTVYITGLPYSATPPTQTDWTGSANAWNSDFVRLHKTTITKQFYCPEDINTSVTHNVYVRRATVSTTYELLCSGTSIKSITPKYMTSINDGNSYATLLKASNPTVACKNSYGNPNTLVSEGTHAKIYSITVQYR